MQKICYTCVNDRLYTVNMFRNGVKEKTLVEKADDSIPLWFRKAGIYSPLPRKLTCDPKYNAFKNPIKKKGRSFYACYKDGIVAGRLSNFKPKMYELRYVGVSLN